MPTREHALMIHSQYKTTYQRLKNEYRFAMCEVEGGETLLLHIIDVCTGALLIENKGLAHDGLKKYTY